MEVAALEATGASTASILNLRGVLSPKHSGFDTPLPWLDLSFQSRSGKPAAPCDASPSQQRWTIAVTRCEPPFVNTSFAPVAGADQK